MSRKTQSIPVAAKIELTPEQSQKFELAWQDGGTYEIFNKWGASGWAYDIKRNGEWVYVEAIAINPPYDEEHNIPDNYQYDEDKMVFMCLDEMHGNFIFALNKNALEQFVSDLELNNQISYDTTVKQHL